MIYSRNVAGQVLLLECSPILHGVAEDVLDVFALLSEDGRVPRDGFRIRFGWSLLSLRRERRGLRVCEPRFAGDPLTELNSTIDITLNVLVEQVALLRAVGVEALDVAFDQQIVVAGDALKAPSVHALRTEPHSADDSGWFVAPVPPTGAQVDVGNLSVLRVHELVVRRPVLLTAMTFPVGYLVTAQGDRLIRVIDPDKRVLWTADDGKSPK